MFWGVLLILAGLILLGSKLHFIPGDFWDYLWPLVLIAWGAKVIFDRRSGHKDE